MVAEPSLCPISLSIIANHSMVDLSTQQFYEIRGPEESSKKPRLGKKELLKWVFLASLVVFSVVGLLAIFRYVKDKNVKNEETKSLYEQTAIQIEREVARCNADEQTLCASRLWTEAAFEQSQVEYCALVLDEWLETCVTQVATKLSDTDACVSLQNEAKIACEDDVLYERGVTDDSLRDCEKISNEGLKNSCASYVVGVLFETGSCPRKGFGSDLCNAQQKFQEVVESGDCLKYQTNSSGYEACIDVLSARDSDDDGLTDLEELWKYKTDPKNADTDGDSYLDSLEVEFGFNPLQ